MSVWTRFSGILAVERIAAQLQKGEVSHAWLLTGPRGAGKRGAAFAMAAALLCERGPGAACGECSGCTRALRGRHPDLHHVSPEGPIIPVDVIREAVIPEAARSPFEAVMKVFLVEDADRMNDAAQNALLKTLEEPQPDTVFVLVSDHEEEVLETIRSRCRVVRLDPVPLQRLVELLMAEGASENEARRAAAFSEGDVEAARAAAFDETTRGRVRTWRGIPARLRSPLDALDAAAEVLAEAKAAAKEREKQQKEEVVALAEAMGEGRGTAAARNALAKRHRRELRRAEEDVLLEALGTLGAFYRDVLAARTGHKGAVWDDDAVTAWAGSTIPDAALVAAVDRCVGAAGTLSRNANVPLALESALVELARVAPGSVISD
ncbi:MAG: DNA polymerase III subunit delta' [Actinomycetota bacterium]|nr:DNA polymerase III subunit delta' [Actinomycetota bacterium]